MARIKQIYTDFQFRIFACTLLFALPFCLTAQEVPKLPAISFKKNACTLTTKHKATLDSIIQLSNKYPEYTIVTGSYISCRNNTQLHYKRLNTTVGYLLRNGMDTNRIYCGLTHNEGPELLSFRFELMEAFNEPAPPHPNLQKKTPAAVPKE